MQDDRKLPAIAWYLVQCKPRQEQCAWEHLNRQGFECFYPHASTLIDRAGKTRRIRQPLFPGYLFIHLGAEDNWAKLRSTRGVSRVVAFDGWPCRVEQAVIDGLRLRHISAVDGTDYTAPIKEARLDTLERIVRHPDGLQRVVLFLNYLSGQRAVVPPAERDDSMRA